LEQRQVGGVRSAGPRCQLRGEEVVDERCGLFFVGRQRARVHDRDLRRGGAALLPLILGRTSIMFTPNPGVNDVNDRPSETSSAAVMFTLSPTSTT
jgi:hypothetical protein